MGIISLATYLDKMIFNTKFSLVKQNSTIKTFLIILQKQKTYGCNINNVIYTKIIQKKDEIFKNKTHPLLLSYGYISGNRQEKKAKTKVSSFQTRLYWIKIYLACNLYNAIIF